MTVGEVTDMLCDSTSLGAKAAAVAAKAAEAEEKILKLQAEAETKAKAMPRPDFSTALRTGGPAARDRRRCGDMAAADGLGRQRCETWPHALYWGRR